MHLTSTGRGVTPLDITILAGLARGHPHQRIGCDLHLTEQEFGRRIRLLFVRLGARSGAHAVALAYRSGWMGGLRREARPAVVLSDRQRALLGCLAEGRAVAASASVVGLAPKSLGPLLYELRTRLGARTDAHAVALAVQHGYLGGPVGSSSAGSTAR
ncbi:hypothetical protein ABT160_10320 [Streptomyces sp. NPDC001941]|uniref:hypothetical protein n=1 Tax=Streptomyces sp. NPDC001941 TaxID=3154659 RepID=UPI00331F2208